MAEATDCVLCAIVGLLVFALVVEFVNGVMAGVGAYTDGYGGDAVPFCGIDPLAYPELFR